MADRYSFDSQQRRLPCRNVSGVTIPAFGCVRVSTMTLPGVVEVGKPDEDEPLLHGFTWYLDILADGYGEVTFDLPTQALYTGSAPAHGDRLKIVTDQFGLEIDPDETEGIFIAFGAGVSGKVYVQSLKCEC